MHRVSIQHVADLHTVEGLDWQTGLWQLDSQGRIAVLCAGGRGGVADWAESLEMYGGWLVPNH